MSPAEHVLEVAPGLFRVTLPVPFELGAVNTYVLEGRDGAVLVDCGPRHIVGPDQGPPPHPLAHGPRRQRRRGAPGVRCWVAIHEDDAVEAARYRRDPDRMLSDVPFFLFPGVSEGDTRAVVVGDRFRSTPAIFAAGGVGSMREWRRMRSMKASRTPAVCGGGRLR